MSTNALQALADSSAWKEVRDTYLVEKLADLKDVTKPIGSGLEEKPAIAMLAKIAASKTIEEIIDGIDMFSGSKKKTEVENFD